MAVQIDHADSDGLLRDSGAGDSQTEHSNGLLCAFKKHSDAASSAPRRGGCRSAKHRVALSVKEEC